MSSKKISDLPISPARVVASEAQQKGKAVLGEGCWDINALLFLGLCQIIHELREEVRVLKGGLNETKKGRLKR